MTDIDRIHMINKSALSEKDYFISLLSQGQSCALLSDSDIERIQAQLLSLLKMQTEKYNHGDSSSIRAEKAQELLSSILYTLGMALKTYPCPENAVNALKQERIEQLFETGFKRIERKIQICRQIHRQIKKNLFQTQNVFFKSTIVDGINGFFKLYNPEFSAHEIHITADYPTFNGVDDLVGVEFIAQYLNNIVYENRFCLYFSTERVDNLLCGLDENYSQILMNIYEPVLTAALGCVLTNQPISSLCCDINTINEMFNGKALKDIERLLTMALERVIAEFSCSPGLSSYMHQSVSKIAVSVENAIRLGHLETVFLIPSYPENKPQIIISYGERMNDRDYGKTLDELMQSDSAEEKAKIITSKIHSLGDLLEILRDAELTHDELLRVFKGLPPEIIAALLKQYSNSDFLYDEQEFNIYSALQSFKASLPCAAQKKLEKAAEALRFDT